MKVSIRILCMLFLASFFVYAESNAGWIENGVPLTRQWDAEGSKVIVSDGDSGTIIAYQACFQGVARIVAQRVNSLGVPLWGEEGITICSAIGQQDLLSIASDGSGGAIIAWLDTDIYVQRVNSSGTVLWTLDGVLLCTASAYQYVSPQIVPDGGGGVIAAWRDTRNGNNDIYAQRVNSSGSVMWTGNGIGVCTATGSQFDLQIATDNAYGAIITWVDDRNGNYDIYAQRVYSWGSVGWTASGVSICNASRSQVDPRIISDGAGGAIITWPDYRSAYSDIYAQRVNSSGTVQWTANGVALCAAASWQYDQSIVTDGAGGAIVAWEDYRNGDADIFTQRVNSAGTVQWTANGVILCTDAANQVDPQIIADNAGGAIIAWPDYRGGNNDIYAQRMNATGLAMWTANGIGLCTATGDQVEPQIIPASGGGAIIAWCYEHSYSGNGIYAQRVTISGAIQWEANGISFLAEAGMQEQARIARDGDGGAVVAWCDTRNGNSDIYAQRINAAGTIQWISNGAALCASTGSQTNPEILSDGAGGTIVAWQDDRSGNSDIYVQRVDALGIVQWATDGISICTAAGEQDYPRIASDGAGGAIIAWRDHRNGSGDIYAQRVNSSGAAQWALDGVSLCAANGEQGNLQIEVDGAGGAIVTWQDNRNGNNDIYAQRVNGSGTVLWTADGEAVCTAAADQTYPQITPDGISGAVIAWQDYRNGNYDVYAQRISAAGAVQWTADGVLLCTADGEQESPLLTTDTTGGAIVVWMDVWGGGDLVTSYVQRINGSGAIQWPSDGVRLCTAAGNQRSPQIISDGNGGAIITWSSNDIYVQRINASGDIQWSVSGIALCTAAGGQSYPYITSDEVGGALIAWQDGRCGLSLYAQRVRASGELVATLLQSYSAELKGVSVNIYWSLFEIDDGARFSIFRASAPEWKYKELDAAGIAREKLSFRFTDVRCEPGSTYKYRIGYAVGGTAAGVLFETDAIALSPLPVTLFQNHPNPFNPLTVIGFYLSENEEITLDVFDVRGERIARLADGRWEKGYHEVRWDGRNSSGAICSSGIYFGRLRAGKNIISQKMVIMR